MTDDGTGFVIGETVLVDNSRVSFEGTYLGLTENGPMRVRDEETGEVLLGSIDFVEPID